MAIGVDIAKLHEPRGTHSPSLWVLIMSKGISSDNVRVVEGELVFTVVPDDVSVSGGKSRKLKGFKIHTAPDKHFNKLLNRTLLP